MASHTNVGREGRTERPCARGAGLVVREVADEVLIYDLESHKAVCLNKTAALVWRACDGQKTVRRIARDVAAETGEAVPEELVWLALEQLGRDHLLDARVSRPVSVERMTRRELMRRLGLAAAIALPVVTSIVAPTPAQAASCLPSGAACTDSAQCCSGVCDTTVTHVCVGS
jgi:hypothetical protein